MNTLIAESLGWSQYRRIQDVGCGKGHVSKAIMRTHPNTTCVLCDLPCVMEEARREKDVCDFEGRLSFRDTDFFAKGGVPSTECDALFMKWIIHDWTDERCLTIL